MSQTQIRLSILLNHFTSHNEIPNTIHMQNTSASLDQILQASALPSKNEASFSPELMFTQVIQPDPKCRIARQKTIEMIEQANNSLFHKDTSMKMLQMSREEKIQINYERLLFLIQNKKLLSCETMKQDYALHFAQQEPLAYLDYNLLIKSCLLFNFFAGAIINLGTEQQQKEFLPRVDSMKVKGCFMITELTHGSNVQQIQTTATYSEQDHAFIIHTPHQDAIKFWIGSVAHATHGIVFAQLYTKGKCHGVHGFIVPLRNEDTGEINEGVTIGDCGPKVGLDALDNGFVSFSQVKIPQEYLLSKFASVDEKGNYHSPIKSNSKRFATTMGQLTMGRTAIVGASFAFSANALNIAIRYSLQRTQFGISGKPERAVFSYETQKLKLIPGLASCYACLFAFQHTQELYLKRLQSSQNLQELHVVSAGFKALTSNMCHEILTVCRKAGGGHTFSALSFLGEMKNSQDVTQTFEGENTVLLLEVGRHLLSNFSREHPSSLLTIFKLYISEPTYEWIKTWQLSSSNPLRNIDTCLQLLQFRSYRMIKTVATRLQHYSSLLISKLQDKANTPDAQFQAFNYIQQHLVDAATAFLEHLLVEIFVTQVKKQKELYSVLEKLCNVFALQCIQRNLDFFILHHCISTNYAKAVQQTINHLVNELSVDALALIDSFMIPNSLLATPFVSTTFYQEYMNSISKLQLYGNVNNSK